MVMPPAALWQSRQYAGNAQLEPLGVAVSPYGWLMTHYGWLAG